MADMHYDGLIRTSAAVGRLGGAVAEDDLLIGAQPDITPDSIARRECRSGGWDEECRFGGSLGTRQEHPCECDGGNQSQQPRQHAARQEPRLRSICVMDSRTG